MIGDVDNDKILISNNISFSKKGYKYFICYKYAILYNASKNQWICKLFCWN